MAIWVIKMGKKDNQMELATYYVSRSGLLAVPRERLNDISNIKTESGASEAKWAIILAVARRALPS